jgi:hypothetical protein
LTGVGSLSCEEVLGVFLVFIGVSEVDLDEGRSSSWVMEDSLNDSSDVSLSLREVEVTISRGSDSLRLRSRSVNSSLLSLSLA